MGYEVYEDQAARDWGVRRWAGYGVPAECDWPDCPEQIDRGLAYRCKEHTWYGSDEADAIEHVDDGCGLTFCEQHRYDVEQHEAIVPKPDSREWIIHQLIDPSWAQWRNRYPRDVRAQQALLAAGAS